MISQPNVLFIAIDDLFDFNAFRHSFGVEIQTPNLDRLFGESTVFKNAFATTPVCNPSRTATLTGKSPFETQVHDNVLPWYEASPIEESLPAILKDAGYHTASAGKVFHGYKPQPEYVNDRIFSEPVPNITDSFNPSEGVSNGGGWASLGFTGSDDDFYDHKVADWGIEFLDRYDGEDPFMLMLGFKHPHNNFELPQEYYDLYDKAEIRVPTEWAVGDLADAPAFAAQFMTKGQFFPDKDFDTWQATVEGYLAAISHADAQVGRVLDALETSGHEEDTMIVLFSDHGFQLGDKDHFGKFTLWEESARAPLAIKVPGAEAAIVETPVGLIDILPTVLDAANLGQPDYAVGDSLLPLVDPVYGTHADKPVFTHVYGSMSLRSGDFRYIRYADGSEELYDMAIDPAQIVNLVDDPVAVETLAQVREELFDEAEWFGISSDPAATVLHGDDGSNVFLAQPATLEMYGGDGDDVYFRNDNSAAIVEAADGGIDTVYLSGLGPHIMDSNVENAFIGVVTAPDRITLNGNELDNHVQVTGASVVVNGGDGNDTILAETWSSNSISGDAGDDYLQGGAWFDNLIGGAGNDTLVGMRGTDILFGGAGADLLDGSTGFDTADYRTNTTDIHVSLFTGRAYGGEAQGDQLVGIERIWGSEFDDVIMGDYGDNVLDGRGGADFLHGYGGNDYFVAGPGADGVVGGQGFDILSYRYNDTAVVSHMGHGRSWGGDANGDSYHGIEALEGSRSHDTQIGDAGNNRLDGWLGDDYLHGGFGDDTLIGGAGADGLVGGHGTDLLDYGASRAGVHIDLGAYTASGGDAEGDWFWSVEAVSGSAYADTLIGGADENTLSGNDGDDYLSAGIGSTQMNGGAGADIFAIDAGSMREGAFHLITDYTAQDTIALIGDVTVADVSQSETGSRITLLSEMDGVEIMSILAIEGTSFEVDNLVRAESADDLLLDT